MSEGALVSSALLGLTRLRLLGGQRRDTDAERRRVPQPRQAPRVNLVDGLGAGAARLAQQVAFVAVRCRRDHAAAARE